MILFWRFSSEGRGGGGGGVATHQMEEAMLATRFPQRLQFGALPLVNPRSRVGGCEACGEGGGLKAFAKSEVQYESIMSLMTFQMIKFVILLALQNY